MSFAASPLIVLAGLLLAVIWVERALLPAPAFWQGHPHPPHFLNRFQLYGARGIWAALLIGGLGVALLPRGCLLDRLLHSKRFLVLIAAAVLLAFWVPPLLVGQSTVVGQERYWWLRDDAMISMRYARNLASGWGLVWNASERVEGYTNFLWTLYMGLIHVLPLPDSKTSLAVLITNVALATATIPLIPRFVRGLGGGTGAVIATVVAYVLSRNAMRWTVWGFETTLMSLLFLLCASRIVAEARTGRPRLSTHILIGSLSLVRADAVVVSALLWGASAVLTGNRRMLFAYAAIGAVLPLSHEIFRILYYHDVLPNTAYLKTVGWEGRHAAGFAYVTQFARKYVAIIALAILGAAWSRSGPRLAVLAVLVVYAGYVAHVGGDAFDNFRFFVPVLPVLFALAFLGVEATASARSPRLALTVLCLATMPIMISGYRNSLTPRPGAVDNLRIGLILKQNAAPTSALADVFGGSPFYFSRLRGVDLLGKSDRHIARLPVVTEGSKPGHNKFDFDYSLAVLRPDFVIWGGRTDEEELREQAKGDYAFLGRLGLHPFFRQHYLPNQVPVRTRRGIYVYDRSQEMAAKDQWRDVPLPAGGPAP